MKLQVNKKIVILSASAVVALTALGAVSVRLMGHKASPTAHAAHSSKHEGHEASSAGESESEEAEVAEAVVEAHDASEEEVKEEVAEQTHEAHDSHASKNLASESHAGESHVMNDEQSEGTSAHRAPASETHEAGEVSEHAHEQATEHSEVHQVPTPGLFGRFLHTYGQAFISIQTKVDELERAETENEHLRLENAHLRVQAETLRLGCKVQDSKTHVEKGLKSGGIDFQLTDIDYQPPSHLLPEQLYTLGVTYFKAHEDEKAVKIFNVLTEMQGNDSYKTAQTYLMSGVAWYRLEHFQWADAYFERALKTKANSENQTYHAQARLWRAMVAQKDQKRELAQGFLKDLIEHHPHSTEAAWVNPKEGGRAPATSKSVHLPDLKSKHKSEAHGSH